MNFSCDRCQKRFSTSEEPVPGRPYRVRCACGNMIVLDDPRDPGAQVNGAPAGGDLFTPAARRLQGTRAAVAAGPQVRNGRLARRDPYAVLEDSGEHPIPGPASFDDMLGRARRQGFVAGSLAGALGGLVISAAAALLTARPVVDVANPGLDPHVESALAQDAAPRSREVAREVPTTSAAARRAATARNPPPAAARALLPVPPREAAEPASAPSVRATEPAAPEPPEAPTVARQLDEREVAAALRARRDAFEGCLAATSGDAASARGHRFRVTVVIHPSGHVSDAHIDDPEIDGAPLGACLLRLARTMSFAPFDGEPVRVELPLRFGDAD